MNSSHAATPLLIQPGMTLADAPAEEAVFNPMPPGYGLTWQEAFEQPVGTPPNPAHWSYDLGDNGWGNAEMQNYVDDLEHAQVVADPAATGGTALQITLTYNGQGLAHGNFASARLLTQGKVEVQYGYVEARLHLPSGQGVWPAFWMLGTNIGEASWPACGEIDIMENRGDRTSRNDSSLHGPGYSGDSPLTGDYTLPDGQEFPGGYHTFGVLWEPDSVTSFVDGVPYATHTPDSIPGKSWAYNHPFFFLVNVAVGGHFSGLPDETTVFPQTLRVDYIRVYQPKA